MVRVAINGFGRIGRLAFRLMYGDENFEIVAINDLTNSKTLANLLKYDSSHGRYKVDSIEAKNGCLIIDGKKIKISAMKNPEDLPWKELDVDVVIESTGFFRTKELANKHIIAGAKRVVISAPAKGDMKTIVYNVNDEILDGSEIIVSGASCTTNCLSPVAKILDDNFGIVKGLMTTVHSYTNDQSTLDSPHSDLRRGRTAAQNIVPTTTGAAVAVGKVLPQLEGKLDGGAIRVPTQDGSLVDLVVELKKNVTVEEINKIMKESANETLGYTEDPIVSTDIIGITYGSLFDAGCTKVLEVDGKQMVKLIMWYDNEMSYTAQLVRLVTKISSLIK